MIEISYVCRSEEIREGAFNICPFNRLVFIQIVRQWFKDYRIALGALKTTGMFFKILNDKNEILIFTLTYFSQAILSEI